MERSHGFDPLVLHLGGQTPHRTLPARRERRADQVANLSGGVDTPRNP
jgi:hypothetical protein